MVDRNFEVNIPEELTYDFIGMNVCKNEYYEGPQKDQFTIAFSKNSGLNFQEAGTGSIYTKASESEIILQISGLKESLTSA